MTLFTGHTSHVLGPVVLLNVVTKHTLQFPGTPANPTSQVHAALPACDTLFAAQDLHVEELVAATLVEKLFAGQTMHGKSPASDLYVPTGHP